MASLIKVVRSAFRSPPGAPAPRDETERRQARSVVRRVATGNIHLQRGEFATKEDLDRQYERVQSYKFDDAR